jgi:hypothetical protein
MAINKEDYDEPVEEATEYSDKPKPRVSGCRRCCKGAVFGNRMKRA